MGGGGGGVYPSPNEIGAVLSKLEEIKAILEKMEKMEGGMVAESRSSKAGFQEMEEKMEKKKEARGFMTGFLPDIGTLNRTLDGTLVVVASYFVILYIVGLMLPPLEK